MDRIIILSDPAINDYGPTRPPLLISRELAKRGHEVSFISPIIGSKVRDFLDEYGINYYSFDFPSFIGKSPKMILSFWVLENIINYVNEKLPKILSKEELRDSIIINFSNIFHTPSHIWYAQGIFSKAFQEIDWTDWPLKYNLMARLAYPLVKLFDYKHVSKMNAISKKIIANSRYTYQMYESFGFRIDGIINPPLDLNEFKPTTKNPEETFILTYIGKETDFKVLKKLVEFGVKIVGFGGKERYVPPELQNAKNFHYIGSITTRSLVDLYSNAKFTLFPFTHEPFGYIPIESFACGTPVLTYNKEGPGNVVIDGFNGWLANSRAEIIAKAIWLWKNGYDEKLRRNAYVSARKYDVKLIFKQWENVLEPFMNDYLRDITDLSFLLFWKEIFKSLYSIIHKAIAKIIYESSATSQTNN